MCGDEEITCPICGKIFIGQPFDECPYCGWFYVGYEDDMGENEYIAGHYVTIAQAKKFVSQGMFGENR